ncbi:MAG TPA: sodium:proton antiporter, partial [Marinobacter hydrocarbonoclasticus]|nr:sodium:proton antiporter [Marinobacter nauticus]
MNHASDLILIGSTLLLALAAHAVGQKVHVPRVTLLLLLG